MLAQLRPDLSKTLSCTSSPGLKTGAEDIEGCRLSISYLKGYLMSKVLTDGQKSAVRKQGDDLIEALHQVEEKNELAHSLGLAEGYIKALYAC